MTTIDYENDCAVQEDDLGLNLLEISLKHKIPHVHACGGHARCSTCRVMVLSNPENVAARNEAELELATKKGFGDNIRLACQTHITGPVKLRRLVIDEQDMREANLSTSTGREKKLAILFSDIRGFTSFSERHLPYDVVHSLNRYFHRMGESVKRYNGRIDKYMGDGLMALFGLESDNAADVCRDAVCAGLSMIEDLESVNDYLYKYLGERFNIGIGIHYGEVIVGDMGHPEYQQFSALGDNVNLTSRIESTTKKAKARLLISRDAFEPIRDSVEKGRVFEAKVKGKSNFTRLYEIVGAKDHVPSSGIAPAPDGVHGFEAGGIPAVFKGSRDVAEGTFAFEVQVKADDLPYKAGQFVELTDDKGRARYFSIASAPGSDTLLFASRLRTSDFKHDLRKLAEGTPVKLSEAQGDFFPDDSDRPLAFIAGGIGITPVRAIIEQAARDKSNRTIYLFYSNRTSEQVAFLDDFKQWAAELPNFHFVPTVTKFAGEGWSYASGRVDAEMLKRYLTDLKRFTYYVVGSDRLVLNMHDQLKAEGVPEDEIRREGFAGY